MKVIQNILRGRKTKRICHKQTYLKSMVKGSSLNRKAIIEGGTLENHEERTQ